MRELQTWRWRKPVAHRREVNLYLYRDGNNDSFIDGIYLISLTKVFISVNEYADLSQTSSVRRCLYVQTNLLQPASL